MIIAEQIKLPLTHSEDELRKAVFKKIGLRDDDDVDFEIIKRSIDARKKPELYYVYSVKVSGVDEIPKKADKKSVKQISENEYRFPVGRIRDIDERKRPVIIGFGPCGMFAALELAMAGFRPVVLERGCAVEKRTEDVETFWKTGDLDEESNVQFGEGGAGAFSDGKLNTNTGSREGRSKEVLKVFARHGAPKEILYDNKPHIGTDVLCSVVKSIRERIISLGGEVRFRSRFEKIMRDKNGDVSGCIYRDLEKGKDIEIQTTSICIAIGHSARDTFLALNKDGVRMEQKEFAVGIRMEHPQILIDRFMYGDGPAQERREKGLPAADYKLTGRTSDGRGVYSFCMCPGGYVVNSSSSRGGTVVNGMSYHSRAGENANSAIIVTVTKHDFGKELFSGMRFQESLEKAAFTEGGGSVPVQLFGDFKDGIKSEAFGEVVPSVKGSYVFANLKNILPEFVSDSIIGMMPEFGKRIKGFDMHDSVCLGVETRTSSPVRILRNDDFMSEIPGIFPCGEGAGYAGGITSSAVDGIRVAESIAKWTLGIL